MLEIFKFVSIDETIIHRFGRFPPIFKILNK